jgi:PAS domain S-box-containing protein
MSPPKASTSNRATARSTRTRKRGAEATARLHSAIINNMAEGVCLVCVGDATIVYANPRFERMFGYGPGEMTGLAVARVNCESDARTAAEVAARIIAELERNGEATYEVQNVRKDGTPFWCRARTTTLDHPRFGKVWLAVHEDITARKQAEAELLQSRERLQLVQDASSDGLWDWDIPSGRAYLSPRYYEITGYRPGDVAPDLEFYKKLVHPDDAGMVLATMRAHLEGRTEESVFEHRMITRDGSVKWILGRGKVVQRDNGGAALRMVGTIRDITARKRMELERATALERLAVVEERERQRIARELHDQTAQRLVALAVDLKSLETNLATGRSQGERVQALRRAVDDLQQQVRQMAWDLRAGEPAGRALQTALREYAEDWSERAGVPMDFECRGLDGDRLPAPLEATLYRVAQEALANVEKHAQAHHVSVLLERDRDLARLTVEDDGRGFDPDGGRGASEQDLRLGLLGMKERVALAGGTLVVESSPGAGTTILVRIPIRSGEEAT